MPRLGVYGLMRDDRARSKPILSRRRVLAASAIVLASLAFLSPSSQSDHLRRLSVNQMQKNFYASEKTILNLPTSTDLKNDPIPSYISLCEEWIRREAFPEDPFQPFVRSENKEVCRDWTAPHYNLMDIVSSTLIASVLPDVQYKHYCETTRMFDEDSVGCDHTTIQQALGSLSLEGVDDDYKTVLLDHCKAVLVNFNANTGKHQVKAHAFHHPFAWPLPEPDEDEGSRRELDVRQEELDADYEDFDDESPSLKVFTDDTHRKAKMVKPSSASVYHSVKIAKPTDSFHRQVNVIKPTADYSHRNVKIAPPNSSSHRYIVKKTHSRTMRGQTDSELPRRRLMHEPQQECAFPPAMDDFALITKTNAVLAASAIHNRLAIGGKLQHLHPQDRLDVAAKDLSFVHSLTTPSNAHFAAKVVTGVTLEQAGIDFGHFEWLAQNIQPSRKVFVETHGGVFNSSHFKAKGNVLVVFNTDQDVVLTEAADGSSFHASILAPFSTVELLFGESGMVEGSIVAKEFIAKGDSPSKLELGGNVYKGYLNCEPELTKANKYKKAGRPLTPINIERRVAAEDVDAPPCHQVDLEDDSTIPGKSKVFALTTRRSSSSDSSAIEFNFWHPVKFDTLGLWLAKESKCQIEVTFKNGDADSFPIEPPSDTPSDSEQIQADVSIDEDDVTKVVVSFEGDGSVSRLEYCVHSVETPAGVTMDEFSRKLAKSKKPEARVPFQAIKKLVSERLQKIANNMRDVVDRPDDEGKKGVIIYVDAVSVGVPVPMYKDHIRSLERKPTSITILSSPLCATATLPTSQLCMDYLDDVQTQLRSDFAPIAEEVNIDITCSTAAVFSRLVLAKGILCPPNTPSCLWAAVAKAPKTKAILLELYHDKKPSEFFDFAQHGNEVEIIEVDDSASTMDLSASQPEPDLTAGSILAVEYNAIRMPVLGEGFTEASPTSKRTVSLEDAAKMEPAEIMDMFKADYEALQTELGNHVDEASLVGERLDDMKSVFGAASKLARDEENDTSISSGATPEGEVEDSSTTVVEGSSETVVDINDSEEEKEDGEDKGSTIVIDTNDRSDIKDSTTVAVDDSVLDISDNQWGSAVTIIDDMASMSPESEDETTNDIDSASDAANDPDIGEGMEDRRVVASSQTVVNNRYTKSKKPVDTMTIVNGSVSNGDRRVVSSLQPVAYNGFKSTTTKTKSSATPLDDATTINSVMDSNSDRRASSSYHQTANDPYGMSSKDSSKTLVGAASNTVMGMNDKRPSSPLSSQPVQYRYTKSKHDSSPSTETTSVTEQDSSKSMEKGSEGDQDEDNSSQVVEDSSESLVDGSDEGEEHAVKDSTETETIGDDGSDREEGVVEDSLKGAGEGGEEAVKDSSEGVADDSDGHNDEESSLVVVKKSPLTVMYGSNEQDEEEEEEDSVSSSSVVDQSAVSKEDTETYIEIICPLLSEDSSDVLDGTEETEEDDGSRRRLEKFVVNAKQYPKGSSGRDLKSICDEIRRRAVQSSETGVIIV